ncbi:MAG: ligase-associated DNA damage response endonuclease PdeM [Paracoccaceae bacterium]
MLDLDLGPARLSALTTGALYWPAENLLCVSDLHLGRSERLARRGGALLPPYETRETLEKLDIDLARTGARAVICLGDSFDDQKAAGALDEETLLWLSRLMAGRDWTWITGNHDPGPLNLGGAHRAEARRGGLVFRHIGGGDGAEVSGHFHPKASLPGRGARPCFLLGGGRLILPAYGHYTGGLSAEAPLFDPLVGPRALAILTGPKPLAIPRPR